MEEKIVIKRTDEKTIVSINMNYCNAVLLIGRALHVVAEKINDEAGISVDETIRAAFSSAYLADDEFDEIARCTNRRIAQEKAKHIDEMKRTIDEMEGKHMN